MKFRIKHFAPADSSRDDVIARIEINERYFINPEMNERETVLKVFLNAVDEFSDTASTIFFMPKYAAWICLETEL